MQVLALIDVLVYLFHLYVNLIALFPKLNEICSNFALSPSYGIVITRVMIDLKTQIFRFIRSMIIEADIYIPSREILDKENALFSLV